MKQRQAAASDIQKRTFGFAVRILRLVRSLPKDTGSYIVERQLARCGTSVGANVEEAQGAHSRADFARRMNIARAEAREALYWLRLAMASGIVREDLCREIVREAEEIVSILTAIVKTTRSKTAANGKK